MLTTNPVIFRAYDIRGIFGKTYFANDALKIGYCFGKILKKRLPDKDKLSISICYDGRLSSPILRDYLIKGLMINGIEIIDIGLGPSFLSYFSGHFLDVDATIMITGSHSEKDVNGLKFTCQNESFFKNDIQIIKSYIDALNKDEFDALLEAQNDTDLIKNVIYKDIKSDYIKEILRHLTNIDDRLKIAWDCGNGATGALIEELTSHIQTDHVILFPDVDGTFPNHHPDPSVAENLDDLKKAVLEHGCDVGFAFDGDGDRIGIIDDKGTIMWCDELLCLLSKDVLNKHKGAKIVADLKCSGALFDYIKDHDGIPIIWKSGHANIRSKMKAEKAFLGGELSGHIFFSDDFLGHDDGFYCSLRLLNILLAEDKSLSELRQDIPKRFASKEIRHPVLDHEKFAYIEALKKHINALEGWIISEIDGIRASNKQGWFLVRASNTENVLSIRAEGHTKDDLENLKDLVNSLLNKIGLDHAF